METDILYHTGKNRKRGVYLSSDAILFESGCTRCKQTRFKRTRFKRAKIKRRRLSAPGLA